MNEDCFWCLEDNNIKAICVSCAKKKEDVWYWNGKEFGYGEYDLYCSECHKLIHKGGVIETDTAE